MDVYFEILSLIHERGGKISEKELFDVAGEERIPLFEIAIVELGRLKYIHGVLHTDYYFTKDGIEEYLRMKRYYEELDMIRAERMEQHQEREELRAERAATRRHNKITSVVSVIAAFIALLSLLWSIHGESILLAISHFSST